MRIKKNIITKWWFDEAETVQLFILLVAIAEKDNEGNLVVETSTSSLNRLTGLGCYRLPDAIKMLKESGDIKCIDSDYSITDNKPLYIKITSNLIEE